MFVIEITETFENPARAADALVLIAELIEAGYEAGIDPHWRKVYPA